MNTKNELILILIRLCHELNHVPLRCEEVEKKKQTDARTFLENEMSEAVIR